MTGFNHNSMLPLDKLNVIAEKQAEEYATAQPFPHGVYDDVFAPELLDKVIEEFNVDEKQWREFDTKYEKKLQMNQDVNLQVVTRALIHNLNSEPFLSFLSRLTGIQGLIPDPYLVGGGLHRIPKGGKLGIHVDFNGHRTMNVYRRINVLVYLNKDWKEEYGGHFELWRGQKDGCEKRILPIFNRMAIFSTTSNSFHGHPNPLTCPDDRSRISLALYYYTAENGEQKKDLHSTVFMTGEGKREELGGKKGLLKKIKDKIKKMV